VESITDEPDDLATLAEEEHGDVDGNGINISLDDKDLPRPLADLHRTYVHYSPRCFLHPFSPTCPPHQTEPNF
jgi:hypothetical protein